MFNVELQVAGIIVNAPGVILLGLTVGILAGLFGVGGGFLMTPMLRIIFGIPYNVAVGSELLQMIGTSVSSAQRHYKLGNVNVKFALISVIGLLCGTELGVRIQNILKESGYMSLYGADIRIQDFVMSLTYIVLLLAIGISIINETKGSKSDEASKDTPALGRIIMMINLKPFFNVKESSMKVISVWAPIILAFFVGILTGMLGVGGGFVNFPMLIYVFGLPAAVAAGTSSLQVVFAAGYGASRHAVEANVDLLLVGLLMVGSITGAQFGALITKKIKGDRLKKYFGYLVLFAVTIIIIHFMWELFA